MLRVLTAECEYLAATGVPFISIENPAPEQAPPHPSTSCTLWVRAVIHERDKHRLLRRQFLAVELDCENSSADAQRIFHDDVIPRAYRTGR